MPERKSPNILLIMTDQQRFNGLGLTNDLLQTPTLDRLAQEGMFFNNAYTPCSLCTPARASVLTGLYPHDHGLITNNDMYNAILPELYDGCVGFSELLVEKGYKAGFIGKWHVGHTKLPSTFGFEGMDLPDYGSLHKHESYHQYLEENGLTPPQTDWLPQPGMAGAWSGPTEATSHYYLAERSIDLLERWHDDAPDSPFCLWLNFWGPHSPYCCEEPYASMYDPADIEPWPAFEDNLDAKPPLQKRFVDNGFELSGEAPWDHWAKLIALYFGRITAIDAQIGRVVATLDKLGMREDTLIIFTTDHGDLTGDHGGLFDKGSTLYEATMHIPFIANWPGTIPPNTTHDSFVSLLDIPSTLLALAGCEQPYTMAGQSLTPVFENPDITLRDEIAAEWHGHRFLNSQRMLADHHYKYVFSPAGMDELYDRDKDPNELTNEIDNPAYAKALKDMQGRLMQHLIKEKDPLRFAASHYLPGAEGIHRHELAYPSHFALFEKSDFPQA